MRLDEPPDDFEPAAPVVPLHPGQDREDDDRTLTLLPRPAGFCQHKRTELSNETRRAYCRDCNEEVPCFDVLKRLAQSHERFIADRREAERRKRLAAANLKEMLRDERNAKSRRRHWRSQEPEAMGHLRALAGLCSQIAGRGHPLVRAALDFIHGDVDVPETRDGAA